MSRIINGCFVATVAFLAAGLVLAGDQKDPKAILDKAIMATGGEEKIGDRATVGIKVSSKGHRDIGLYFDKETGMLAKTQMRVKDILSDQEMDQESLPSDYKDAGGVKRAHKMVINRDGKKFVEAEVQETKVLQKLDDKLFQKP